MEIHTIILAALAALSGPMLYAYWATSRSANKAHLELLLRRDRNDGSASITSWKRLERMQTAVALGYFAMFLIWSAVQLTCVQSETTIDKLFVWTFAASFCGIVVLAEHFKFEDLLNSMGLGQRPRRLQLAEPA